MNKPALIKSLNPSEIRSLKGPELVDYFERIRAGDERALNDFILAYDVLIKRVMKMEGANDKKIAFETNSALSYEDVLQEGRIGVLKAIKKFDATRGFKFSTYAVWWVRASVFIALQKGRFIKLGVKDIKNYTRTIDRARIKLQNQLGFSPTVEEIAAETGLAVEKVTSVIEARSIALVDFEDTFFSAASDFNTEAEAFKLERIRFIEYLLAKLPDREREVIESRFGLKGRIEKTLVEVGADMDVSRERVRQIQKSGIESIQANRLLMAIIAEML